jgi:multidrug resistance efflux pump
MALIDEDTLRVEGYFEKTKLPRIHVNDKATIRLIGETSDLSGHVESIAGGIEDRERSAGSNLLANVNPTFSWVRLAQRVPVRIVLDPLPDGVNPISGRTATVSIDAPANAPQSPLVQLRQWLSWNRAPAL